MSTPRLEPQTSKDVPAGVPGGRTPPSAQIEPGSRPPASEASDQKPLKNMENHRHAIRTPPWRGAIGKAPCPRGEPASVSAVSFAGGGVSVGSPRLQMNRPGAVAKVSHSGKTGCNGRHPLFRRASLVTRRIAQRAGCGLHGYVTERAVRRNPARGVRDFGLSGIRSCSRAGAADAGSGSARVLISGNASRPTMP